ncbi:MAG: ABC transporter permease [Defluviitaleaceae bacterium]|nr:ABC transporter permease [Defluviitaleaceae bacterium]
MNFSKRALLSLKRQWVKTMLLLGVIFLLGSLMAFAFTIRQAIINTDMALRQQLPAVTTIHLNEELLEEERELRGEWVEFEVVTPALIREIGTLPYVRMFDYTAWGHHFFSDVFIRAFDADFLNELGHAQPEDWGRLSFHHDVDFERFTLKGIHHHEVVDIEAGLIELVAGRAFTENEVDEGAHVVLVSQDFLVANRLSLGSQIVLDYRIYDEFSGAAPFEVLLAEQAFELEIIGVFEHQLVNEAWRQGIDINHHIEMINRIYVPNRVVESVLPLYLETFSEMNPELIVHLTETDNIEEIIRYEQLLFLLYDPTDLVAFAHAASQRLPAFWTVSDLSNAYADIASSMVIMGDLANGIVIGTIFASWTVLSMLILVFIKDRQLELGIYLALGEGKKRLTGQILIELLLLVTVAITCALFVGHLMASELSTVMIRTDLMRQAELDEFSRVSGETPETLGFRFEMTHEEMLALYDTSLNTSTILLFYLVTSIVVSLSTLLPTVYLLKMNPKDVLLKGSIG